MTLGSRLADLLLPAQASTLAPSDCNPRISFEDASYDAGRSSYDSRTNSMAETFRMEAEEEEGRPPYTHVRHSPS